MYSAEYGKDRGLICKFLWGFFSKNAAEEVSSNHIASSSIGRSTFARGSQRRPAVGDHARRGGSMDRLPGAHRFLDSEHESRKQNHQAVEKLTTNSPRRLARIDRGQGRLTATEGVPKLDEIRSELQQRLGLGLDE